MKWVNLLSMTSYCWTWVKLGFVKVSKRGTLQKSGREVLREEKFKKKIKTLFFLMNYATH